MLKRTNLHITNNVKSMHFTYYLLRIKTFIEKKVKNKVIS